MAKEIERKFLVDRMHPDFIALLATKPSCIKQGYIMSDPKGVVRVRILDDQAFLTIKTANSGISKDEFEYEIPVDDGERLLSEICSKIIEKKRYYYSIENDLTVELDEFSQIDLLLAEVELPTETTDFDKPVWFLEDVSDDPRYFNNTIANEL